MGISHTQKRLYIFLSWLFCRSQLYCHHLNDCQPRIPGTLFSVETHRIALWMLLCRRNAKWLKWILSRNDFLQLWQNFRMYARNSGDCFQLFISGFCATYCTLSAIPRVYPSLSSPAMYARISRLLRAASGQSLLASFVCSSEVEILFPIQSSV